MASLLFFFALSLAGLFDMGLTLTSAGGSLAQKQGYAGSFFTGVLATVVATPCTAPLMGAAIGFALAQSAAWLTLAVFTALALGLALPYLALSWQPAFTRFLPRPGAWMETLKQLVSVPLFATVIWLAWVYASLYGTTGVDREAVAAGVLPGAGRRRVGAALGGALGIVSTIAAALLIALALSLPLATVKVVVEKWQPYTAQSLAAARESGTSGVRRLHRSLVPQLQSERARPCWIRQRSSRNLRRRTWCCCAQTGRSMTTPSPPS